MLSNWQEASVSQMVQGLVPNYEMKNLRRLLAAKDNKLFKNQ
jgi:hypothetical protein